MSVRVSTQVHVHCQSHLQQCTYRAEGGKGQGVLTLQVVYRYLPSFSVDVNCNRPGTNMYISHKLPPSTNTMIVCTQGQTPFFISQIDKVTIKYTNTLLVYRQYVLVYNYSTSCKKEIKKLRYVGK